MFFPPLTIFSRYLELLSKHIGTIWMFECFDSFFVEILVHNITFWRRIMVPVKGTFNKKSLDVGWKALKDWRMDCLTKTLQQNTVFIGTWFFHLGKSKDKLLASLQNKGVSSKRKRHTWRRFSKSCQGNSHLIYLQGKPANTNRCCHS